jgi:hypothetical protein
MDTNVAADKNCVYFAAIAHSKIATRRKAKELSMKKKTVFSILILIGASLAAIHFSIPRAGATGDNTFTVDVALDANTYMQNNIDPNESGMSFTRGDTFILGGTIYPGGTLPSGTASNDPNAPGGIGKITCRGTYIVGTNDVANGATLWTNTTELYLLPDDNMALIADGRTPNVMGATVQRAVLGGTGRFRGATGEVHELELGTNATGFCNLRITFHLKRVD